MQALRAEPGGCTPQAIVAMDPARLDNLIGKVGFHRRKTVYLQQTAQILLDQYDGDIPDSLEGLMALPGCGPKMSYLALSSAWGKTIGIGVDTHVHRISERLGWTMKPKTPEDTRHQLEAWLPLDRWVDINPMLVGFGQIQCLPIGPRCESCPVRDACPRVGVPRRSAKATARTVKMADTYSMADLAKDEAVKQET
ncbi:DNA glycosylase [Caulochytrium protostelioides]|nr:DNA glycosylase [Caulochytrium protostelioides]